MGQWSLVGGEHLDQEWPVLSWHLVPSQPVGRWGGELDAHGAGRGAGHGGLCSPYIVRGPAPQTRPQAVAMQQDALLCSVQPTGGGADGACWWDCLGWPPPLLSVSSLAPIPLPTSTLSALWHLSLQNAFPSPTVYKQRRCPFPGPVKGLFCLFPEGRGSPVSLLVFLVPPHCHGAGIGPHLRGWKLLWAVAGKEVESWRWNSAAGLSPYLAVRASQIHAAKGSLSLCLQAPCPSHPLPPTCQSCPGKGGRTLVVLIKICCRGNEAH